MIARHPRARIAGAAIWLIAFAALVWLTDLVSSGGTRGFDVSIRNGVHGYASPALTSLAEAVTTLGSVLFLSVAFAASLIGLLLARLKREAIRLTAVMAGAVGLENGMKYGVRRIRPDAFFGVDPTTYSFPSGHSLLSLCFYFAVAILIARHVPGRAGRLALGAGAATLVGAIGLSRIYLGVHYPTDVIGGFLTAGLWVALVRAGERLWWPKNAALLA